MEYATPRENEKLWFLTQEVKSMLILFTDLFHFCLCDSQGKFRRSVKPNTQSPVYEEMAGLQAATQRLTLRHLEEKEASEYRNCSVKKSCPENHYETPRGALSPRKES